MITTRSVGLIVLAAAVIAALTLGGRDYSYAKKHAATLQQQVDSLEAVSKKVDIVYVTDTLVLWRNVAKWDTIEVDVEKWKHDTVKVVEYVALADSTIKACIAAVLTCEQRVGVRDQRIAKLEELNAAIAAQIPTRWENARRNARNGLVTVAVWEGGKALLRYVVKLP